MQNYHLIAVLKDVDANRPKWDGWLLLYRDDLKKVAIVEDWTPHSHASEMNLPAMFAYQPSKPWVHGDGETIGSEAPGWFERICKASGCEWFFFIAQRIANGESVSLNDVTSAYSHNHKGEPMPQGTIEQLFKIVGERDGKSLK